MHEYGRFIRCRGLEALQKLEHLFLAVAGGLPDQEVRRLEIRTGVRKGVPVTGLDQRAQTSREDLLGRGYGGLLLAAQTHGNGCRRLSPIPSEQTCSTNPLLSCHVPSSSPHPTRTFRANDRSGSLFQVSNEPLGTVVCRDRALDQCRCYRHDSYRYALLG